MSTLEDEHIEKRTSALRKGTILSWPGTVPRFATMREGGPGTMLSLVALFIIGCILVFFGISSIESDGIGSGGPFLILIGVLLFGFLVIWILIKGILRQRDVTFVIHEKGIEIIPSELQSSLDTWMATISRILFWITWKGGQWSAWAPCTPWRSIRNIIIDNTRQEILIAGGNWDIRLTCPADLYPDAVSIIQERKPKRAKVIFKE
ncbi:MAG: hypothetical protein GXY48_00890 [Methanomicrobiales archaeon]|nr:hypothetical protein [Methanomicrobiales archaeon]